MARCVGVLRLGLCYYKNALRLQESIASQMKLRKDASVSGVLILVEHPPVYTYGIRKEALTSQDVKRLQDLGAEVEYAGRGGLVTFHGPGQMVAWPVLDLKAFSGIKKHVHCLEESVIRTCNALGLNDVGRNTMYPGVWRGEGKLCAVGVRASRFVTTHGLALNVCTNLSWFDHIIPCGIEDKKVTSLSEELKRNVTVEEIIPSFLKSFTEAFSVELIEIPDEYDLIASSHL